MHEIQKVAGVWYQSQVALSANRSNAYIWTGKKSSKGTDTIGSFYTPSPTLFSQNQTK